MKKMSKGMLMTALICGAVYLGGSPVYASELQEFSLDEYVVTAARTETKLVDTPANISVVDSQTIEERHYQDVSEVLKDVPGATILDTGVGAYEKTIRLNGDDRVLVLVDGRKVNIDMGNMNGRSSYDFSQLPDVSLIERIEVLKGAGGALYGSDAVGGVVNIITKKADLNYGKINIGFGSNGAEDLSAMYSMKKGKTGIILSASKYEQDYYKFKNHKTGSTQRWPGDSDFKNEKVSMKLTQELDEISNIELGYDYSKFEGTNPYKANAGASMGSFLDKKTENIYIKYNWLLNQKDSGYIQIYHNEFSYNNWGLLEEKDNGIDIQQAISTSVDNKLVFGGSWKESDVFSSYSYDNITNIENYDRSVDNLAFFINDTYEFAPSWTLNAGIRFDKHSEAGRETTLSAGLNKKFNDDSHAYINWGQVFKAPTLDDLYYNNMNYGNPDLEAETGDTWTIGYTTKVSPNTSLGLNYFESDLDDAIIWEERENEQYTYDAKNVDKQKKKGLEFTINHSLTEHIELEANYTYLQIKNNKKDNNGYQRDKNVIPNMYRAGIRYHKDKWNADLFMRAGTGASLDRYLDSNYLTVDLSITYKPTSDLSIYAKGYNLFNEAYAEFGGHAGGSYNYPAQSRRFIVGAEYKF